MGMCQGYANNSKVNSKLGYYMKGQSFNKMDMELGILSWMPFKVSDPARYNNSLFINPILIQLAWQGVSDSMPGSAESLLTVFTATLILLAGQYVSDFMPGPAVSLLTVLTTTLVLLA